MTEKSFNKREARRYNFIKRNNWKVIRIISYKDIIPVNEDLIKIIEDGIKYLEEGHNIYTIDLDKRIISCSQFEKPINCSFIKYNYSKKEYLKVN